MGLPTDSSHEWRRLYRGRSAVERELGRLENEYGLTPLRTRGLGRVRQHADLLMIARLGQALVRARAVRLARVGTYDPGDCRSYQVDPMNSSRCSSNNSPTTALSLASMRTTQSPAQAAAS